MSKRVLTRRELNRALLARQMLLQRETIGIVEAVERLAGLQAQIPNPPYIGLWTRLENFERDALTRLMQDRQIVRAALMRSTLHLVSAEDQRRFCLTLQPALTRALYSFFGKRARGLDIDKLVEAARPFIEGAPVATGDIRKFLQEIEPECDGDAMAYAVRSHLPLVQIPPGGTWGRGSFSTYATAASYLGEAHPPDLGVLLRRYLAAFGPASVMDFQMWTGMTKLKDEIKPYTEDLRQFEDESGTDLFDLPDGPLPVADTPAPPRFMPEYDNLVIAHKDRTRIIADEDYRKVFLSAGRVSAMILVDGFVSGTWKSSRQKQEAALTIEPFREVSADVRQSLREEGQRLLRFIEPDAEGYAVVFTDEA